jgi:hypothetical protein
MQLTLQKALFAAQIIWSSRPKTIAPIVVPVISLVWPATHFARRARLLAPHVTVSRFVFALFSLKHAWSLEDARGLRNVRTIFAPHIGQFFFLTGQEENLLRFCLLLFR